MNTKKDCGQTDLPSITSTKSPCAPISSHKLKSDDDQLAEKVKSISQRMRNLGEDSFEELVMVDTIQRLGIEYLFQEEIDEVLYKNYYVEYSSRIRDVGTCTNDLHEVSLRFRLLRQEGYDVSSHIFDGFTKEDGKFNEELGKNTKGIVSLFEASHMSMREEFILDEANAFTKRILSESLETLDESNTMLVKNALKHPFHKTLARFTAHDCLSMLSSAEGWRNELQELAKMEFKATQGIYQNEIIHISNWWKKLGLAKELKFARDQPLKWHMWSLAALSDPSLSEQRVEITKPISFVYIIDDIFDVCGKPEDLSLFTDAVNRWEMDALDVLPNYMKLCLKALFDVTNEISQRIWLKYLHNPKDALQKAWADLFNAFLEEHKWLATGYVPTTTEYLKVATITSGAHVVLTHMYFILGGETDTFNSNGHLLDKDYTRIIASTARILRLWDDLGSSKDEGQDGHDGSYIKCYINERESVTNEAAIDHVIDLISGTWKSLNEELMQSPPYPLSVPTKVFNKGCLNLVRMVPLMYDFDESHKLPNLEKFVKSLLYEQY